MTRAHHRSGETSVEDTLQLFGRRHVGGRYTGVEMAWALAATVLFVVGLAEVAGGRWHSPWPVSVVDLALMSLPVALVSVLPVQAALLSTGAFVFECALFTTPQSLAALFAVLLMAGGAARYVQGRLRWPVLGALLLSAIVTAVRDPTNGNKWDYLFTGGIWAAAAVAGLLLRSRHTAVVRAVGEAVRLRTERGIAVENAINSERSRIARDLHDVVAHAVSLMVIQAAAGRSVLSRDAARAEGVFDTIELTGQRALGDLRRLLGVLQAGEPDEIGRPGLEAIEDLVRDANDAGVPCRLTWSGDRDGLPDGIDVAAFRVVQESVTNALKHGARAGLEITVERSASGIRVNVLDSALEAVPADRGIPGSGRGLRGMRERVGLYDGTLSVGPETNGWRVEAYFPVGSPS